MYRYTFVHIPLLRQTAVSSAHRIKTELCRETHRSSDANTMYRYTFVQLPLHVVLEHVSRSRKINSSLTSARFSFILEYRQNLVETHGPPSHQSSDGKNVSFCDEVSTLRRFGEGIGGGEAGRLHEAVEEASVARHALHRSWKINSSLTSARFTLIIEYRQKLVEKHGPPSHQSIDGKTTDYTN